MVFSFLAVSTLAAAPSDSDTLSEGLGTGWSDSNSGYPYGWQNSWFWLVYDKLRSLYTSVSGIQTSSSNVSAVMDALRSGWDRSSSGGILQPSGYGSSWFSMVFYELRQLENVVSPLSSGWGYSSSSIYAPSGSSTSWFYMMLSSSKDSLFKLGDIASNTSTISTGFSVTSGLLTSIRDAVVSIKNFFVSEADLVLKQQTESTVSTVSQEYFSGDGGSESSIKASNAELGDFKGLGKFLRSFAPSGVSISSLSDLFDQDNDSFGLFSWFSQDVASSLNPIMNSPQTRSLKSAAPPVDDGYVDFYQANVDAIQDFFTHDEQGSER